MDIHSGFSRIVPAVVEFDAAVLGDRSDESVNLSEPVRAVHLIKLNESRLRLLEIQTALFGN